MTEQSLVRALADLAVPPPASLLARVGTTLDVGDRYTPVDGPTGPVWVVFTDGGINHLAIAATEEEFLVGYAARWGLRPLRRMPAPPAELVAALRPEHRERARTLRYDLAGLSRFQRAVLQKTAEIPPGEVRPYAWLAREVGQPGAVRAVGTALGRNPIPILIPCHRVVRSDGRIGDYALGSTMKSRLLTEEGVDLRELVDLATRGIRYLGNEASRTYCHPSCRVLRGIPRAERIPFRTAEQAVDAGYAPCARCRPAVDAA